MIGAPPALFGQRILQNRILYGFAVLLFLVLLILGWRELPPIQVSWLWLWLTAAIAPATVLFSVLEYILAGRFLGHRIPLKEAMSVTLFAAVANLLPLPGSVLVRSQALRERGSAYSGGLSATVAVGMGWLAVASLSAGGVASAIGNTGLGVAFLALGLGAFTGMYLLTLGASNRVAWIRSVLLLETCFVVVSSLRLFLVFRALGISGSLPQAVVITLSGALASAVGIFPAGLGLQELLAGGLAVIVEVPGAAGTVCTAIDRLVGILVLGVCAGVLVVWRRERVNCTPNAENEEAKGEI